MELKLGSKKRAQGELGKERQCGKGCIQLNRVLSYLIFLFSGLSHIILMLNEQEALLNLLMIAVKSTLV